MARAKPIQNSFNGGEFSSRMFGRTDIQKYGSGAQTIENWHVANEFDQTRTDRILFFPRY